MSVAGVCNSSFQERAVFYCWVLSVLSVLWYLNRKTSSSLVQLQHRKKKTEASMEVCNSDSSSETRSVSISGQLLKIRFKVRKREDRDGGEPDTVCNETNSHSNQVSVPCNKFVSPGRAQKRVAVDHDSSEGGDVEVSNYGEKQSLKLKQQLKNHGFGSKGLKKEEPIKLLCPARAEMKGKASKGFSVTDESREEQDAENEDKKNSSPPRESKIMCSLCGKNFPSMKSLFGHMRCHPERDWRGIVPPKKVNVVAEKKRNRPPSSAVSDSGMDALKASSIDFRKMGEGKTNDQLIDCRGLHDQVSSLPSWSVTAKRGKRSTFCKSPKRSEDQVSDAAYHLMMLSHGSSKSSSGAMEERDLRSTEDGHQYELQIEPVIREFGLGKEKLLDLVIDDLGYLHKLERVESENKIKDFETVTVENLEQKNLNYRTEDRKRKRKIRALENLQNSTLVDSVKYRCNTCSKSFSSHQALGGHRASHKKGKNCSDELPVGEVGGEDGPLMEDSIHADHSPDSGRDPLPEKHSMHRCQICNKVFPSGQALGGHKRCHWTGDKPAMADPVAPTASSVTSVEIPIDDRKTPRRLLDFDLNEPPMILKEDPDSEMSTVDVVPAPSQYLGSKEYASFYSNSAF